MSRISSKNTKPELIVRSFLHTSGMRFRLKNPTLPGKPDIIIPKYKTVIFVDGCFWHRHGGCKYSYNPKSRKHFWKRKFENNIRRDQEVNKAYESLPWNIFRIWECEISLKKLARLVKEIKTE